MHRFLTVQVHRGIFFRDRHETRVRDFLKSPVVTDYLCAPPCNRTVRDDCAILAVNRIRGFLERCILSHLDARSVELQLQVER